MPAVLAASAGAAALDAAKDLLGTLTGRTDPAKAKARATAEDFEAMFLEQSLERLTSSAGTEGPLGDNGTGGSVYRSLLVKEYAHQIQGAGGIGIADQVYRELLRLQESGHDQ